MQIQTTEQRVLEIARVAHNTLFEFNKLLGDAAYGMWDETSEQQRQSIISGVHWRLNNPDVSCEACHEEWLKFKRDQGWKYGPTKDYAKLEHPALKPWESLPITQKLKDSVFKGIVLAMGGDLIARPAPLAQQQGQGDGGSAQPAQLVPTSGNADAGEQEKNEG